MRKVGQFRYLLRRPPPPKVLDSPDLVRTQYGPSIVAKVDATRGVEVGAPLKADWDDAALEAAFPSGFPDPQLPVIDIIEETIEEFTVPMPNDDQIASAEIAVERPTLSEATTSLMRWARSGETGRVAIFDTYLIQMARHLYNEGTRGSALRAFNHVRESNMNAFGIRYLYRAARELGRMTFTTSPGPGALRRAFQEANVTPSAEDGLLEDEAPSQLVIPRTPVRNPRR